jgi:ribosomal protein S18 acetylase RimI-like enzyme
MIRPATSSDIAGIAGINRLSFSGNKPEGMAEKWVTSHLNQGDAYHYFVDETDGKIVGYIGWEIKGGFARAVPVIELEQLAVHPDTRGQGLGRKLIEETFVLMKQWVKTAQPEATKLKVFVLTKKDNVAAQAIYKTICPDPIEHTRNIYGSDEVVMTGTYEL